MSDQSSNLKLSYLMPSQAQKHVTVNESLLRLDALVQAAAVSRSIAAQPGGPADGALYILPAGKSGAAWDSFADGALAYYRDGAWEQLSPRAGWRAWVADEALLLAHDGAAWVSVAADRPAEPARTGAYTLVAADARRRVVADFAAAADITVPGGTFAAGETVEILSVGAANPTLAAGADLSGGLNLHAADTATLDGPGALATLWFETPDTAWASGRLVRA